MDAGEVLEAMGSSQEKGLSESEVKERTDKYGPNDIPRGKKRSWFVRLLMQFHNVLIYVLIAAAIITALMDHWIDTWVILAVVIINALIGFITGGQGRKGIGKYPADALAGSSCDPRWQKTNHVDAEELVPGDIVMLKSGDKVPADISLVNPKISGWKNRRSPANQLPWKKHRSG
jgi:magnesium-transporting ATPase (P-type)